MNTSEINDILRNDKICKSIFKGVFPADKISTQPGRHWCSIYINQYDRNREFFDSYGNHPSYYGKRFVDFLNRHCKRWTYNQSGLQGPLSATCGQYCIFYLLHRCKGIPLHDIVNMFTHDKELNDEMVN